MFTLQEFLDSERVPDHSKSLVGDLHNYFAKRGILIVNMFDEMDSPSSKQAAVVHVKHTLEVLTGAKPEEIPYDKLGAETARGYALIVFSGKETKYTHYEIHGDFRRFEGVMKFIRETKIPIGAFCAGHQLFGAAYGGKIELIGQHPSTGQDIRVVGWLNPYEDDRGKILTPDHPLFLEYLKKTDGITHHNHAEHVTGIESRVQILAESIAPNDKHMAYILELKYPKKHVIGFQNHPERGPRFTLNQNEQPHYSGLVLLVSALDLLTVNSQKYTKTKQELYLPR